MYSVAIAGASGYSGAELIRLIHEHPNFELVTIAAGTSAGKTLSEVHPQFSAIAHVANLKFLETTPELLGNADLIFCALPHGESAELISQLPQSAKVIDLGADFRLADAQKWAQYYNGNHAGTFTYGLPELAIDKSLIASSSRIANPGCYATAIQLSVAPLIREGLIDATDLVVVAASGTSGAGRNAKVNLLASEVMGSMTTYKVGGAHQHIPEIEQELQRFTNAKVLVNFTPMLAPMPRGILATTSAKSSASLSQLRTAIEHIYADCPFVTLLPEGQQPTTAATLGSNSAHIQVTKDEHTGRVTVICAIDNLGKGAAGQAVQNANLIFGLPETAGLSRIGIAP